MPISLTREEFIQRLDARRKVLRVAIDYDLRRLAHPPPSRARYMVQVEGGEIELSQFIGQLINNSISRSLSE